MGIHFTTPAYDFLKNVGMKISRFDVVQFKDDFVGFMHHVIKSGRYFTLPFVGYAHTVKVRGRTIKIGAATVRVKSGDHVKIKRHASLFFGRRLLFSKALLPEFVEFLATNKLASSRFKPREIWMFANAIGYGMRECFLAGNWVCFNGICKAYLMVCKVQDAKNPRSGIAIGGMHKTMLCVRTNQDFIVE